MKTFPQTVTAEIYLGGKVSSTKKPYFLILQEGNRSIPRTFLSSSAATVRKISQWTVTKNTIISLKEKLFTNQFVKFTDASWNSFKIEVITYRYETSNHASKFLTTSAHF